MKTSTFFYIVFMLCVIAAVGVIIWYFAYNQSSPVVTTPTPTPTPTLVSFLGSAARGDFLTVEIMSEKPNNFITYKNLTNGISHGDLFLIDQDGYMVFRSLDHIASGLMDPNLGILLQLTSAGPSKSEKGFALGLLTSPFDAAGFPPKLFNYMQFRTNNNGFEVGYIDARDAVQVKVQHCTPAMSRYTENGSPGTGNIQDGVEVDGDFAIDARTFLLSDDGMHLSKLFEATENEPAETVTIFKTEDDDLVIDLNNGSIFAFQELADDTKPAGNYTGLLYGKNNAQGNPDNTESGDEKLTKVSITFTDDQFSWVEGDETYSGTIVPFHDVVNMTNYTMHGLFYSRVIGSNDALMDFCFVKGQNGKLLCAYFSQALEVAGPPVSPTPPPGNRNTYQYRHGAAFFNK